MEIASRVRFSGSRTLKARLSFELYNLKTDPTEQNNVAAENPEIFARLKNAYDDWYADVSSTRPDNYAPPLPIVGTQHENPTVLTRQDWMGLTWKEDSRGHWVVEVAEPVAADIEVILHPEIVTGNAALIALKIGEDTHELESAEQRVHFRGIFLPQGEQRIELIRTEGDHQTGAWQIVLHCTP